MLTNYLKHKKILPIWLIMHAHKSLCTTLVFNPWYKITHKSLVIFTSIILSHFSKSFIIFELTFWIIFLSSITIYLSLMVLQYSEVFNIFSLQFWMMQKPMVTPTADARISKNIWITGTVIENKVTQHTMVQILNNILANLKIIFFNDARQKYIGKIELWFSWKPPRHNGGQLRASPLTH